MEAKALAANTCVQTDRAARGADAQDVRQIMTRIGAIFVFLLVAAAGGCAGSYAGAKSDGEELVDLIAPEGTTYGVVVRELRSRELPHHVYASDQCAGPFGTDFRCLGGQGVVATLEENISLWHSFYSPTLRVFLAFDSNETLRDRTVFLDGGDRNWWW